MPRPIRMMEERAVMTSYSQVLVTVLQQPPEEEFPDEGAEEAGGVTHVPCSPPESSTHVAGAMQHD